MHPVLCEFSVHGHAVTLMAYTCFLGLAALAAVGLGTLIAWQRGLDARKAVVCLLIGLVATLVGARLAHWLTNPASFTEPGALWSLDRTNLSVFAGLLLGTPAVYILSRIVGINAWRLADAAAPGLALAAVLARVGCFLNGCCFGLPAHLPWGTLYPTGSNAHLAQIVSGAIGFFDAPLPVHPTQLYEAFAGLLGGGLALWLLRRKVADGTAFLAFVLWFASVRWLNLSFLWIAPSYSAPRWVYPALYALVIVASGITLMKKLGISPLLRSKSGGIRHIKTKGALEQGGTRLMNHHPPSPSWLWRTRGTKTPRHQDKVTPAGGKDKGLDAEYAEKQRRRELKKRPAGDTHFIRLYYTANLCLCQLVDSSNYIHRTGGGIVVDREAFLFNLPPRPPSLGAPRTTRGGKGGETGAGGGRWGVIRYFVSGGFGGVAGGGPMISISLMP